MDLKELQGWEGDIGEHWYYASKAAALEKLLAPVRFRSIADIGAGSGYFTKHLLARRSDAHQATCVDVNYERERDERCAGKRVCYRRSGHGVRADLYLLMDVLEHVENDVQLLQPLVEAAAPGACFVITVPAFGFLWSGHDVFLGHHRRYTLAQIADVARRAGLAVDRRCYFFGAIFPAVAALRVSRRLLGAATAAPSSDLRPLAGPLNRLLRSVCALESRAFTMNRAFGLTAFVLASRP